MFSDRDIKNGFVPFPAERAEIYQQFGCWENETHIQLLERISQQFGKQLAVSQADKTLSYQALYHYAAKYGSYLHKQGIQAEDFVVIQSPNVIEFFIVLFGLYYIGARPVFCLNGHGAYEIENIAINSRAVGYIKINMAGQAAKDAMDIALGFSKPNFKLWFRETLTSETILAQSFIHLSEDTPHLEQFNGSAYAVAFLQLSGGTTGLPKLIARTHADYLYSVQQSVAVAKLNSNSKQLIVLPVMHNFTMSSPGFLGAFFVGASVYLSTDSSPATCFALIEKQGIEQVSLVPSLVNLWINSPQLSRFNLNSLAVIQVGGAKLLPELAESINNKLRAKLQQVYGMAEGLVNFTQLDDNQQTILYTQGKPLSRYDEIKIVDDMGETLANESIGYILTRGPYTINGYYNSPEINQHSFTSDGFYITGDIGYLDKHQNIVVTGREKEQINRAGEKITPSEIENLILGHPAVRDVSVVAVKDPLLGERSKAQIILQQDHTSHLSLRDIRVFLMKKNIADYKLPDEIELVEKFQYTQVGKVNRRQLSCAAK
ncbi:(2,3-dihydroxybenzoyl)adenylate synthase [Pseudoalteromonas arctica]|uniref:AMP-binding protein n=1 Tax=Pseudoalteromonas arctica TaxID=394751 RepID=A0A7Y0DQ83_9GAMM|nr:AMP-binding protein [Pseudoalteromonas arctica]NMM39599.1 AMP-binding protein [Pseudoalteromonas arctica]